MQARNLDSTVGNASLTFSHCSLLISFFPIARQETAASVKHLVNIVTAQLSQYSPIANLRVLDLCTGTGCIPLLFHHEFYKRLQNSNTCLQLRGVDISPKALALAHENLDHVLAEHRKHASKLEEQRTLEDESLRTMTFSRANILAGQLPTTLVQASVKQAPMPDGSLGVDTESPRSSVEVFISNPPYVSPSSYKRTTARSVRDFEPKLALVPPAPTFGANKGDSFYPHLLDIAKKLSAKFVLLEVADLDQARRVAATAIQSLPAGFTLEIWRDEPSIARFEEDMIEGEPVRVVGEGNGRSVFIQYDDGRALSVDQAVQAKA